MFWVLVALGAVAALIGLATAIGFILPAGHVASRTVRLNTPPQDIWALITDFSTNHTWRPKLKTVERLPDRGGHEVWREVRTDGWTMPLETIESIPPSKLVRKIADPKMPFGGTWTYEFTPDGGGTRLTVTERGEVYNPIFRLFSRFSDMRSTIDEYLNALAAKLGERITLEN